MSISILKETIWAILIILFIQNQGVSSSNSSTIQRSPDGSFFRYIGPADFNCVSDGQFPHESQCELYYECKNGSSKLMSCIVEYDMLFNAESSFCDFAYDTHCGDLERPPGVPETMEPPKTTPQTPKCNATYNCIQDGAFPHPNCELYFDCWKGVATTLQCPKTPQGQEQLFDTEYSGCKAADLTDCGNRIRPTFPIQCPHVCVDPSAVDC